MRVRLSLFLSPVNVTEIAAISHLPPVPLRICAVCVRAPGVPQLSLGQKAILKCTPDYASVLIPSAESLHLILSSSQAYGARGFPPIIPANANLTFEVQLLSIN